MKLDRYVLDENGEPRECPDLLEWARWVDANWVTGRKVALDVFEDVSGEVRVSTVFLAIDHNFVGKGPPLLFETMVFGGTYDGEQYRWATRSEALAGHATLVEAVKGALEAKS